MLKYEQQSKGCIFNRNNCYLLLMTKWEGK